MREKLGNRYTILAIIFIFVFSIILVQLVNLQIVNGQKNYQDSQHKLLNNWTLSAPRGNITDRNGIPIAISRQGFNIQIVKYKMSNSERNEMLYKLIKIFTKNNDSYNNSFSKLITFNPLGFGSSISKQSSDDEKLSQLKKLLKNELYLKAKDLENLTSIKDIFQHLRNKVYEIDPSYNDEDAYRIIALRYEIRNYNELSPVYIAKDVDKKTVAELEERNGEFPGITADIEPVRKYVDSQYVSHVLGYIGNIGEEYKNKKDQGYEMNDLIGKAGVEKAAEAYLRGTDGKRMVEVDTFGRKTGDLETFPAIPGNDVILTLDMRLQKIAAESLERRIREIRQKIPNDTDVRGNMGDAYAGSVVAMNVNTGEILAMASYPSYDPSLFLAGSNNKEAQKAIFDLNNDPKNNLLAPMMNRAISGTYAPGSTYKPLMVVAGLEEGIINEKSKILDPGTIYINDVKRSCLEFPEHGHGNIDLEVALATSCNIFFYKLGAGVDGFSPGLGVDSISKWARYFGFGQKTGLDVDSANEKKGVLATKDYKKTLTPDPWVPLNTAMVSIGQLYNSFTPLQLANYTSTIANGGKHFKPHLIKRVIDYDGSIVSETKPEYEQLPVKKENMEAVHRGMIRVANSAEGTAVAKFSSLPFKVAAKTGTAQTGDDTHSNNGVFVCFAPAGDPTRPPEIAISVVIERGVQGRLSADIANDILKEYYSSKYGKIPTSSIVPDGPALVR